LLLLLCVQSVCGFVFLQAGRLRCEPVRQA
jgi:hypothetical protein